MIKSKIEQSSNDVIQYKKCQSDLNEKDVFFFQIWHHTVNKEMFKLKVSKTFLLLIGGFFAEHDWI